MSVHLLEASLRANATTFDSYSPKGWNPKLQCAVMGPVPSGAELVLDMKKPGGDDWFEHRVELDELGEEEGKNYELHRWDADTEITEVGDCAFTLRAVSELEGVDELLHTGTLTVTALEGEHDYAVALDWLLPLGLVALDVDDDKEVGQSTDTSSWWTASSTGGTILGRERRPDEATVGIRWRAAMIPP